MTSFDASAPDMYGQEHTGETPKLLEEKLKELETELEKIQSKTAYVQALSKCPDQVDEGFKLKFLRCEQFRVDDAAKRLVKYWDKRLEIFGPDRAFLPLTLEGALKDEDKALKAGFVRLIAGVKEPGGRSILYADPSRYASKHERLTTVRALWYVMHAALEDEETQKKGFVIIADPRNAKISQTDTKMDKLNIESIRGCIPARVAAMHLCHMPIFFSIIFPVIKVFLGARLRQRIRLHSGSVEHVLKRLEVFGLTRDKLPEQLGGTYNLDHEKWLADRRAKGL